LTEGELIEGCRNRDKSAREELYRLYMPKMVAVCKRLVNNKSVIEDLVHDGFVMAFLKIADYKGNGSFEGWLRKIFVNISLDYYRKNKIDFLSDYDEIGVPVVSADCDGLDVLDYGELMELIGLLPDNYRVVLSLYCVEGYKHDEIAAMVGISQKTSMSRLLKAKQMLMERLKTMYNYDNGISIGKENDNIGEQLVVE